MADLANYRFLPWTRRGLSGAVTTPDAGAPLAARPQVKVAITVTGAGRAEPPALSLYGPGDVIGIDPRLIVRVSPLANAANVEPNYLAAIEFDPPDFPWMFTPAAPGDNQRLRPWIVLVVVEVARVALPSVMPGRPLPVLKVPGEVMAQELPDLAESWAWAHAQAAMPKSAGDVPGALAAQPDLNVSRLVCPRRLEANKRYCACLVPAFDLGVRRGRGEEPDAAALAGPAWNVASPAELELPVYFHWEFSTGPEGDFESLARRLKGRVCPPNVGYARMYLGASEPELPALSPGDDANYTLMDGAMRSPTPPPEAGAPITPVIRDALRDALNAPAAALGQGGAPRLGPPIYGEWHAAQHTVPAQGQPMWLRQLNLDPRARVAANLGAEVVRINQEEFMQAAWEQVGKILEANELLNRARFSLETARSAYVRQYQVLPPDRLFMLAQPLHVRTLHAGVTVRAGVARTSLPDAAVDPALRRLASPQRPLLKTAARRAGLVGAGAGVFRSRLVQTLAAGRIDVDPTRFVPDGLIGVKGLPAVTVTGGEASLEALNLPIKVPAAAMRNLRAKARDLGRVDFLHQPSQLRLRPNLRATGLVTDTVLANLVELESVLGEGRAINRSEAVEGLVAKAVANPGAVAFLATVGAGAAPAFDALDVDASGRVLVVTPAGTPPIHIATIDRNVLLGNRRAIGALLSRVPAGNLARGVRQPVIIEPDVGRGGVVVHIPRRPGRPGVEAVHPPTNTLPGLLKDIGAITRFEGAFREQAMVLRLDEPPVVPKVVPFAIAGQASAGRTLLSRLDPAIMVPRRTWSMLPGLESLSGVSLADTADRQWIATARQRLLDLHGIELAATFDRIMAAPDLPAPSYTYLAAYDRTRFVPGIDEIQPDTITILTTNPRFIESYLVGLNHEMSRELLWRAYPTDQRGTPFRYFWAWRDGQPDIDPIHRWPRGASLGTLARGAGPDGQVVLLVRGELLRRYPNTQIFAWRAATSAGRHVLKDPPGPGDILEPVFAGRFEPDFTFAGFPLTVTQLQADPDWFFVLAEQPTEPRFGFDEPEDGAALPALNTWKDANWGHAGVAEGRYLRLSGNPLANKQLENRTFGENSAHLAVITLQQPMRVAVFSEMILVRG